MTRLLAAISLLAVFALPAPGIAESAADQTSVFRVEGMTCALCGNAIEKALRGVAGVRSAVVDQESETVTVIADPAVSAERLEQVIESAGAYEAEPTAHSSTSTASRQVETHA